MAKVSLLLTSTELCIYAGAYGLLSYPIQGEYITCNRLYMVHVG